MSSPAGTPITTSHAFAFSVLRRKPRRWTHHVYSTRAPISSATIAAMRFSKPSPLSFEYGSAAGSAHTRSVRGSAAPHTAATA